MLSFFLFYLAWITMAQLLAQEENENASLKDLLSRIDLDELMKKDEPPLIFPKTLDEFGYAFNEYGQLRHTKTGEPFIFNYKEGLHRWNQKRYESLGEIITQYVYELLEKDCKLRKEMLPVDATESEPKSFIYMSEDALTNPDKLLVLIQGSGVVRAGQWARRLIINQDLDSGTQIPFINKAMQEGYGVIVLNPNENALEVEKAGELSADAWDEPAEKRERKEECEGKKKKDEHEKYRKPQTERETEHIPIRENSSPEEHTLYVWDHFISRSLAKNIFVVAHSYGGLSFVELKKKHEQGQREREEEEKESVPFFFGHDRSELLFPPQERVLYDFCVPNTGVILSALSEGVKHVGEQRIDTGSPTHHYHKEKNERRVGVGKEK